MAGAVQHKVSPPRARQRVTSVHQYKPVLAQNPLQGRAVIQGHILNVRILLSEMNEECHSKPDKGFPETVVSCELKSGWCTCSTANTRSFFLQFVCSKKQFYVFQRSSHRVHFTYTTVVCSLSLLRLLIKASPSALVQQPCILCWTIRNWDNHTVCIYSALTLHTVWALCYHFNTPARMIILWKSALLVKSKISEFFMVVCP